MNWLYLTQVKYRTGFLLKWWSVSLVSQCCVETPACFVEWFCLLQKCVYAWKLTHKNLADLSCSLSISNFVFCPVLGWFVLQSISYLLFIVSSQSGFLTSPVIKLSGTCRQGCGEVHVFRLCVWLWMFYSSIKLKPDIFCQLVLHCFPVGLWNWMIYLSNCELRSTCRWTNSPTPTRRRIKSSRDVGELVLNPIQLIRS